MDRRLREAAERHTELFPPSSDFQPAHERAGVPHPTRIGGRALLPRRALRQQRTSRTVPSAILEWRWFPRTPIYRTSPPSSPRASCAPFPPSVEFCHNGTISIPRRRSHCPSRAWESGSGKRCAETSELDSKRQCHCSPTSVVSNDWCDSLLEEFDEGFVEELERIESQTWIVS